MAAGGPAEVMRQQEDIPADVADLIRMGTIASIDLAQARCTVLYGDPEGEDGEAVTPPIRWLTFRAGDTRVWSPPSLGEQVLLLVPDGQIAAAIAVTGIVQDAFPPAGSDLTELILFKDGARIAYDPEAHALSAVLPEGATALVEAPGGLTIRADVAIEGNVILTGGDVIADGISLKTHTHGGVQSGGSQTGEPE